MFQDLTLQWKQIYILPRITTTDSKLRCFQYKLLHNTLYLNQKLFLFCKHNTSLCSFCNLEDETIIHLFAHCSKTKQLWCKVIANLKINLRNPSVPDNFRKYRIKHNPKMNIFLVLNKNHRKYQFTYGIFQHVYYAIFNQCTKSKSKSVTYILTVKSIKSN